MPEIVRGIRICFIVNQILPQFAPSKYVHAHRRFIAARIFRLFLKLGDFVVLVHQHQAETRSLLPRDFEHCNGAGGILFLMIGEHFGIIHFINMVARQNRHIFGIVAVNKGDVLVNRVCRALVPFRPFNLLIGRENVHAAVGAIQIPRLPVADIIV